MSFARLHGQRTTSNSSTAFALIAGTSAARKGIQSRGAESMLEAQEAAQRQARVASLGRVATVMTINGKPISGPWVDDKGVVRYLDNGIIEHTDDRLIHEAIMNKHERHQMSEAYVELAWIGKEAVMEGWGITSAQYNQLMAPQAAEKTETVWKSGKHMKDIANCRWYDPEGVIVGPSLRLNLHEQCIDQLPADMIPAAVGRLRAYVLNLMSLRLIQPRTGDKAITTKNARTFDTLATAEAPKAYRTSEGDFGEVTTLITGRDGEGVRPSAAS